MQLLLDKPLIGLDGKEIDDSHMGKILANALVNKEGSDDIKYFDWALKLYNNEKIELDDSDYNKLYKEIENDKRLTRIVKAQILKEMDRQKKTTSK